MRIISKQDVIKTVRECCIEGTTLLPEDVLQSLKDSEAKESSTLGRSFLNQCIENAVIARNEAMPICQDTGFAVFFAEIGQEVLLDNGTWDEAFNEGVRQGYTDGYLRKSIVSDPLFDRKNTRDNTPCVVHYSFVTGDKVRIVFAPKGGGSENMSAIKMLKVSEGRQGIVDFVVNSVINAGGNPCPPTIVGVGIGGTFEKCAFLAKKALLRKVGSVNSDARYAELEKEILEKINASGVGPQGLGGDTTALAVHIEFHPCHIASLPCAVNLNCHAARHVEKEI
ncbi:MAG: fumarate hydratase [Lentisphaeria bacterium]|nr:fumarate hydratase [Lentisphaeria bacterium]